jgi:predicted nuclease of predicted toxin-antitoxin system
VKVLLDECLPRRLTRDLGESHLVTTVPRMGWAGMSDSELMQRISGEFDVFITVDSNLCYQQKVEGLDFTVIVLRAASNRYETLKPLIPGMVSALESGDPSGVILIGKTKGRSCPPR